MIVEEARAEARTTSRDARVERDHLVGEARRIRMLLHAALDALDEAQPDEEEEAADKAEAA